MKLSVKKLRDGAVLPKRATQDSAGYDLCALLEAPVTIAPGEIAKIPTGIAIAPSETKIAMCIFPRSGLSTKNGITLANSVGLVDSDYRGEWFIPLINHGKEDFVVESGMRIAQMVVIPIATPELVEVEELDETERGEGGFGHSGLKEGKTC